MPTNNLRRDPTRLTLLRRSAKVQLRKRLALVRKEVRLTLVDTARYRLSAGPAQQAELFADWLQGQLNTLLVGWHTITYQAWLKGVTRSYDDTRKGPRDPAHLGGKQEFLRRLHIRSGLVNNLAINQDFAPVDTLARRLAMEFKGVLSSTIQEAARVLLDGLLADDTPYTIASAVARVLGDKLLSRLQRIVSTELTRAHASGQLTALRELGTVSVELLVEWDASNDACPRCMEYDGEILTLDEADGLLPIHPNCVCAWQPVEDDTDAD